MSDSEQLVTALVAALRIVLPEALAPIIQAFRDPQIPDRIYRRAEMASVTGLKPTAIADVIASGKLKPPIPLTERAVGHLGSDIVEYQRQCIAERDRKLAAKEQSPKPAPKRGRPPRNATKR